ncbi:ALPHA-MANNOSIDASE domain protein [Mycobacterium xenopi 4042]|uniref:ALPHA-MANNOSIDASE domain protein n=1 Tax=Mycobacterium xenopi 4042 TaxID=1299334 RepID=X8ANX2_MYCXE|nr:ALPHA-MANNOSIDASE domain protein [Mycobacterium xenopi 4042]
MGSRRPRADRRGPGRQRACLYEEYPSHPSAGEGPWHLLSKGPVVCSSSEASEVRAYHGPLGQRLVIRGASARCCATRRR